MNARDVALRALAEAVVYRRSRPSLFMEEVLAELRERFVALHGAGSHEEYRAIAEIARCVKTDRRTSA